MSEQNKNQDNTLNNQKANKCSTNGCSSCTKIRLIILAILLVLLLISLVKPAFSGEGTWPKILKTPNGELTLYQPQPESYDSKAATIEARAALSFTKTGETSPKFGAILFTAQYDVDRESRTALLKNIQLKEWKFPGSTQEQADKLQDFINKEIYERSVATSLDELIHSLKGVDNNIQNDDRINNNPPRIIYREAPAILILLEGEPIKEAVEGTNFEIVINTQYMMLYSKGNKTYYLNGNGAWFEAKEVQGKWRHTQNIPTGLEEAAKAEGLPEPDKTENATSVIPEIIVTEEPGELISVDGKPDYSQVDGAGLLYVNNTSSILILDISEQDYYTLISGRWFTSKSLADDAKWTYVEHNKVPPEFDNIPNNETTAPIKAAIPGTPEANEAILDATIPQTAEVQRDSPSPEIKFDGKPKFEKTGAKDVEYAVNTPSAVIKAGKTYYLCEEGIWYKASSATGPWEVCTEIPGSIYEIPPECPIYNVTYVRVYEHTPKVVYVGYTPGYTGSYICNGVVVYGTGYYYRPWHGVYYYPRPVTWGYGATYNPYTGFWLGFGIGVGRTAVRAAYWNNNNWWRRGNYYSNNNININNSINIGNRNINKSDINNLRRDNVYKNRDNVKTLQDRRDNLRPEQRDRIRDQATNRPTNGNTRDRVKPQQQPKTRDIAKPQQQPKTRDIAKPQQQPKTRDIAKPQPSNNWQQSNRANNVYSDRSGDVYRSNKATNNWQKMDNNGRWSNSKPNQSTRQNLNRSKSNRQSGATRQRQTNPRQNQQRGNNQTRNRPSGGNRGGGNRRR